MFAIYKLNRIRVEHLRQCGPRQIAYYSNLQYVVSITSIAELCSECQIPQGQSTLYKPHDQLTSIHMEGIMAAVRHLDV